MLKIKSNFQMPVLFPGMLNRIMFMFSNSIRLNFYYIRAKRKDALDFLCLVQFTYVAGFCYTSADYYTDVTYLHFSI